MIAVNCNKCGGSRKILEQATQWQCPLCMKKHKRVVVEDEILIEDDVIEEEDENYTF
jgi:Zn finger protein HypA/HybF involved in hydrogenase expression